MWNPGLLSILTLLPGAVQDGGAAEAHFEARIRPLLAQHCLECHDGPSPKGGLSLGSREGWELGGDSGPAIVPGEPAASLLVRAVLYEGSDLRMPPQGRLAEAEIAALVSWVRDGAFDPRVGEAPPARAAGIDLEAGRAHWAFQPPADPAPPQVAAAGWARDPLDRFVLARLEHEGLAPAAEATRPEWLRRVTFDLIGLPPTPEELDAFLADDAPGAHERVVERLLASPHHGERWARRWLDLARYADSNGVDENLALGHAWRYRDWVVDAFNADKPYDRFVLEQLAGDLLPSSGDPRTDFEAWTATGFLVLGPKMLAEQDKPKLVLDVVDEQLDVAGQAFLGLTIGCARCHDHKFDPISQRDYHALAGIFHGTSTLASLEHVSRWRERELATDEQVAEREAWRARDAELVAELTAARDGARGALVERWRQDVGRYLLAAQAAAARTLVIEAEAFARSNLSVDRAHYGHPRRAIVHTGQAGLQYAEYDIRPPAPGRYALAARYAAQESRPLRLLLDGRSVAEGVLGATTGGWRSDALAWHDVAELELGAGPHVLRVEREVAVPHVDVWVLTRLDGPPEGSEHDGLDPTVLRNWSVELAGDDPFLAPWRALADLGDAHFERDAPERWRTLPEGAPLELLSGALLPRSRRELAGRYQTLFALAANEWRRVVAADPAAKHLADPTLERARELAFSDHGPFALPEAQLEGRLPGPAAERLAAARAARTAHRALEPAAFPRVLAVAEGEVSDLRLFARGSHLAPVGEPIPRGVPEIFTGLVPAPRIPPTASGRLELARWIVHPDHPLTARVAVNRVWQGHFGRGLVESASNFGLRGAEPTHPELLDHLARSFVREGWSLKDLHRRIVLSSTYRQSHERPPAARERDPENRLLAGFPRRRLEAEELRDALLAVGGLLDRTLGGSLLATGNGDYVTNDQSQDAARYASPRRSLYLPIVRNALYDLFSTFDYVDPSVPLERRAQTTIAHQVLWMLNSPLALEVSGALAARLLAAPERGDGERLFALYREVHGRAPSADEESRALAWLERARESTAPPESTALPREAAALAQAQPLPRAGASSAANSGETAACADAPPPAAEALCAHPDDSPAARAERLAWEALCQVLLSSNEFLYLD